METISLYNITRTQYLALRVLASRDPGASPSAASWSR